MPMLERISADTGPRAWIEELRTRDRVSWVFSSSRDDRVFQVPQPVFKSLQRAGVKVPPVGQRYDVRELDQKFRDAGLDLGERISAKTVLEKLGLL